MRLSLFLVITLIRFIAAFLTIAIFVAAFLMPPFPVFVTLVFAILFTSFSFVTFLVIAFLFLPSLCSKNFFPDFPRSRLFPMPGTYPHVVSCPRFQTIHPNFITNGLHFVMPFAHLMFMPDSQLNIVSQFAIKLGHHTPPKDRYTCF